MELIVRASVIYWLLWFLLRVAGKRELAEMTPFELIVLMVMGDLIQQGVTQEDMSLTGAALGVTTIMVWTLILSYLNFRSRTLSEILDSGPAILASHGTLDIEHAHDQPAVRRRSARRGPQQRHPPGRRHRVCDPRSRREDLVPPRHRAVPATRNQQNLRLRVP